MELFTIFLSFFGWLLLSLQTFGLLLLYVVPYFAQTIAIYYEERKREYLLENKEYHYGGETEQSKTDDDYFYE